MDDEKIIDIAVSVDGVPIRLTRERWFHIVENHNDLAGYCDDILDTMESPEFVLRGYNRSLIAVRGYWTGSLFTSGVSAGICAGWVRYYCLF